MVKRINKLWGLLMGGPCIAPQEGQGQDTEVWRGVSLQDHRDKDPGLSLCFCPGAKEGPLTVPYYDQTEEDWPVFSALTIL